MLKEWARYFATFDPADDGITVEFPDLPGAITCGDTEEEALRMAKDCLALHIHGMEEDGDPIPRPSGIAEINAQIAGTGKVAAFVEVFLPLHRAQIRERSVKKTLTIPKWLDDLAADNNVNFSHVLQDALKERLGVSEPKKDR